MQAELHFVNNLCSFVIYKLWLPSPSIHSINATLIQIKLDFTFGFDKKRIPIHLQFSDAFLKSFKWVNGEEFGFAECYKHDSSEKRRVCIFVQPESWWWPKAYPYSRLQPPVLAWCPRFLEWAFLRAFSQARVYSLEEESVINYSFRYEALKQRLCSISLWHFHKHLYKLSFSIYYSKYSCEDSGLDISFTP